MGAGEEPSDVLIWFSLGTIALVSHGLEKYSAFGSAVSGLLLSFVFAAVLSNCQLLPSKHPVYSQAWAQLLPISLALLLLGAYTSTGKTLGAHPPALEQPPNGTDDRDKAPGKVQEEQQVLLLGWGRIRTVGTAFVLGAGGTILGTIVAFLLTSVSPPSNPLAILSPLVASHCAGCIAATYIGGSANFYAVAKTLGVDAIVLGGLGAADVALMGLYLIALLAMHGCPRVKALYPDVAPKGKSLASDPKDAPSLGGTFECEFAPNCRQHVLGSKHYTTTEGKGGALENQRLSWSDTATVIRIPATDPSAYEGATHPTAYSGARPSSCCSDSWQPTSLPTTLSLAQAPSEDGGALFSAPMTFVGGFQAAIRQCIALCVCLGLAFGVLSAADAVEASVKGAFPDAPDGINTFVMTIVAIFCAIFLERVVRYAGSICIPRRCASQVNDIYHRAVSAAPFLSSFCLLTFFAAVGATAKCLDLLQVGPAMVCFTGIVLIVHVVALFVLVWVHNHTFPVKWRIPLDDMLVASNANVGGPTTAAAMAGGSFLRHDLVIPATIWGTAGYAVATGIGLALSQKLFDTFG